MSRKIEKDNHDFALEEGTNGKISVKRLLMPMIIGLIAVLALIVIMMLMSGEAEAFSLEIEVTPPEGWTDPEETPPAAIFNCRLTNDGPSQEDVNLTVSFTDPTKETEGWTVTPTQQGVTVGSNTYRDVSIRVTPPESANAGSQAELIAEGFVVQQPSVTDHFTFRTRVSQIYDVGLNVKNDDDTKTVEGGTTDTIIYNLTLNNTGNGLDEYLIEALDAPVDWDVSISPSLKQLVSGATYEVIMQVQVPLDAEGGYHFINVRATSQSPTAVYAQTMITTIVTEYYQIDIEVDPYSRQEGLPGQYVDYIFTVENSGNTADKVQITVNSLEGWDWSLDQTDQKTIPYQGSETWTLTVDIPSDAYDWEKGRVEFTCTSVYDPSATNTLPTRTDVGTIYDVDVDVSPPTKKTDPFVTVAFDVTVTNTGNSNDTIELTTDSEFVSIVEPDRLNKLSPNVPTVVTLNVTIPEAALSGFHFCTVIATCSDESTNSTSIATIDVNPYYEIDLVPLDAKQSSEPGGPSVTYRLRVRNLGTGEDTIDLTLTGQKGDEWGTLSVPQVTIPARTSMDVYINVSIPANEEINTWWVNVTGRSSEEPSLIDNASFQIEVLQIYEVVLTSNDDSKQVTAGGEIIYDILITNEGTGPDSFKISVWHEDSMTTTWTSLSNSTLSLEKDESKIEQLIVNVPTGTASDLYFIWFNVTSDDAEDSFLTMTEVTEIYDVYIASGKEDSGEASPNTQIIYAVQVYNTGTTTDTFQVAWEGDNTGWVSVPVEYSLFDIEPNVYVIINITVDLPEAALDDPGLADGVHNLKIIITSWNDNTASAFIWLNTTVTPTRDASFDVQQNSYYAIPGDKVIFTVFVTNTGSATDMFKLEDTGQYEEWGSIEMPIMTIAPSETNTTLFIVDVDPTVSREQSPLRFQLIAKSVGADEEVVADINLTVRINQTFSVGLSSTGSTKYADPGEDVVFTVKVVNRGNDEDTFTLGWLASETLNVQGFEGEVTLSAEEELEVNVTVPVDISHDTSDIMITLNVSSNGALDPGIDQIVYKTLTLTVNVNPRYGVTLSAHGQNTKEVHGGENVTFYLKIKNSGTATDTFEISPAAGLQSYWATPLETTVTIDAFNDVIVGVVIEPPPGTTLQLYEIAINVSSTVPAHGAYEEFSFFADVKQSYEVSLSSDSYSRTVDAGIIAGFTLLIENEGNGGDTFIIDVIGLPPGWTYDTIPPISIPADDNTNQPLTIHTTSTTNKGTYNFTVRATSQGDSNVFYEINLIVIINQVYGVDITPTTTPSGTGEVGDTLIFLFEVENLGNGKDDIQLKIKGDHPEFATFYYNQTESVDPEVSPPARGSVTVFLNVTIPLEYWIDFDDSPFIITVEATSEDETTTVATQDFTITVSAVYDVILQIQGADSRTGLPGEEVNFDLVVTNDGTADDNFNLQVLEVIPPSGEPNVDTNIWFSNIVISPSSINNLGSGFSQDIIVSVQPIPDDLDKVPIGRYKIIIEVESIYGEDVKANITLEVRVDQVYGAEIEQNIQTKDVDVGGSVEYSISITNAGNYRDDLTVEIISGDPNIPGSDDWGRLYHAGTGQSGKVVSDIWLNASESTTIILNITVPEDSLDDTVTLTLEISPSDLDGTTDEVDVTADMNIIYDFDFTYVSKKLQADPDSSVAFTLTIKNEGTDEDTFTPAVDEWVHADWAIINPPNPEFSPLSLTLIPGEQGQITMTVYTPAVDEGTIALAGFYNITIRVDSDDGEDLKTNTFIIDLQPMYLVDLELPGTDSKPVDVGDNVTYQFTVTNDGNEPDTFTFDLVDEDTSSATGHGDQGSWASLALITDPETEISTIYLEAGETNTIILTISIPNQVDPTFAEVLTLDITVIVDSETDTTGLATDQFTTTTTINPIYSFTLNAIDSTQEGFAGDTIGFSLKIKNQGTASDGYDFDITEIESNVFQLNPTPPSSITNLDVDATDQTDFDITITSDRDYAKLGIYHIKIEASSQGDTGVTQNITLTIEITGPEYSFTATSIPEIKEEALAGDTVSFTIKIRNTGTATDGYDFDVLQINSDVFTLSPNPPTSITNVEEDSTDQTDFNVMITDDRDYAKLGTYYINLTAISQNDGKVIENITLIIKITGPIYSFSLNALQHTKEADADDTISFTLKIKNTGETTDSYDFDVTSIESNIFTLNPSTPDSIINVQEDETDQSVFDVEISSDRDIAEIGIYKIRIEAISQSDSSVNHTIPLTIDITGPTYSFSLDSTSPQDKQKGEPDEVVVFTLRITNQDDSDSYKLEVGDKDDLIFTDVSFNPVTTSTIAKDATGTTEVSITIVNDNEEAKAGTYPVEIIATSTTDPTVTQSITLNVEITSVGEVEVDVLTPKSQEEEPGEELDYTVKIKNIGNARDTFELSLTGTASDWSVLTNSTGATVTSVTLDSFAFAYLTLTATIPVGGETEAGDYTVKIEATSTNTDDKDASDTATVEVSAYVEIELDSYGSTSKNYDPNEGDTISFKFTIKNNGNGDEDGASMTIDAKSLPDYWAIGDIEFTDLIEAGGSATVTVPFKCENRDAVEDESSEIEIFARSDDGITESNAITVIINVTKPDVTIDDVIGLDDISTLRGKVGSSASITVKVSNDGTAQADSVKVELWEDNSQETTRTISSIRSGQTRQVTLKWDVPSEEVDVLIKLTGVNYESNDDNNELEFTSLNLETDIKFEGALNFSNNNPSPDDTITIKAFLSNSGGNAEDVTIIFFEGTNEIGRDTIDVDYGDTETASITWDVDASSGETLTIKAEVDIKDGSERETSLPTQEETGGIGALSSPEGQTGLMIGVGLAIALLIVGLFVGMMMGKKRGGAGPPPKGGPAPAPAFRAAEKAPDEKKPAAKGPVPFEKAGAPEEEKPPTKQIAKVRCPKCGKTTEVTSTQRPLQIPCSCGTTLMLKK